MIVLALETCSPAGGVALLDAREADAERFLGAQTITSARAHSRMILPAVETLLAESGLTIEDVDVVAASAGPGTFTGVRVGLTLAKAFCEPGRPRLVLVSTLEALAHRACPEAEGTVVVPLLNARRGEVYGAFFRRTKGGLERLCGDFCASPEDALARWPEGPAAITGEGALQYRETWLGAGRNIRLAPADRRQCAPESVALLGLARARAGFFEDPAGAAPAYLRGASINPPRDS